MKDLRNSSDVASVVASQRNKEREYWLKRLSGDWTKSTFAYDSRKTPGQQRQIDTLSFDITGQLFTRLLALSNNSDNRLHIILTAGLTALLARHTGNRDIIIGAPVLKQEKEVAFINTVLVLRNRVHPEITFKKLLLQVRQTLVEATLNQNYPQEMLVHPLRLTPAEGEFPFFDAAILLENIHTSKYLEHTHPNVLFSFRRRDRGIDASVEYNASLYRKGTIERVISHFNRLMEQVIFNVDSPVVRVDILPEEEKKQLLWDFNRTAGDFPADQCVHELFVQQANKYPDAEAVIYFDDRLSFGQLHERSNRLACLLRQKGVTTETSVVVLFDWSVDMVVAIMGVLKAGAAYLPIDPYYPADRLNYILKDSSTRWVLTSTDVLRMVKEKIKQFDGELVNIDDIPPETSKAREIHQVPQPGDMAYIIYTSGSEGRPKGILVQHRSFTEFVTWAIAEYEHRPGYRVLLSNSYAFDSSIQQIFPPLASGGVLHLLDPDLREDPGAYLDYLAKNNINNIDEIPVLMNILLESIETEADEGIELLPHLTCLSLGSDYVPIELVRKCRKYLNHNGKIINGYGPAETSVETCTYHFDGRPADEISLVGKSRRNLKVYILDTYNNLCPIGVPGEICASGIGVARGYVNKPELTANKFQTPNIPGNHRSYIIYKTGDLGRWHADGNVEYLGRIDFQVKVRGYRIELGEIENHLVQHPRVNDALVLARTGKYGDKFLCSYIVSKDKPSTSELREFLGQRVSEYMVPSYFVVLEQFPLNPNGKIDRRALPEPEITVGDDYIAPANEIEKKMAGIWAEVLNVKAKVIGRNANFFDLGGHSLKAINLASLIHKQLNTKIQLTEIFRLQTLGELSEIVADSAVDRYTAVEPAEKKEYYQLSSAQKRMYILRQMDPASIAYNMPIMEPVVGKMEPEQCRGIVQQLVNRHEGLRTSFEIVGKTPVQRVHPRLDIAIDFIDLGSKVESGGETGTAGELPEEALDIINHFTRPFDLSQGPLFRIAFLELGEYQNILLADTHHIVADGVSLDILVQDFRAFWEETPLSPPRLQYKDYSRWQNSRQHQNQVKNQEDYWLKEFQGEIPVLNLPVDRTRPPVMSFTGDSFPFEIGEKETRTLRRITKSQGATMFMMVLAAYNVLLTKLSSQEHIIIGTFVAGRRHADLQNIIGMFVNMLALCNHAAGGKTFIQFLNEVKINTLKSFENQEYQFEDLVDRLNLPRDTSRNPLFDVSFILDSIDSVPGSVPPVDVERAQQQSPGLKRMPISKFDLSLYGIEKNNRMSCMFEYSSQLFNKETVERFANYLQRIVSAICMDPGREISHIEILSPAEKQQLLKDFNHTAADYPEKFTLHGLFQRQVEQTPNAAAVRFGLDEETLTYRALDEKSNQLAQVLKEKGVNTDTIVGIMVYRSLEMIAGIFGILKAGGAYLPIDPYYPRDRMNYMLADSRANLLLTTASLTKEGEKLAGWEGQKNIQIILLDFSTLPPSRLHLSPAPVTSLAYVIYTSGSTGRPKGVLVEHRNVVNYTWWAIKNYVKPGPINFPLFTSLSFDLTVTSIFTPLLSGNTILVYREEKEEDGNSVLLIKKVIEDHRVGVIKLTPSHLKVILQLTGVTLQSNIKCFIVGGETLDTHLAGKILEKFGNDVIIYNEYGPTETTVGCMIHPFCPGSDTRPSVPIGRPAHNVRVYVLDKNKQSAAVGAAGELHISGEGLARGYLNRPESTAEKFILLGIKVEIEEEKAPQQGIQNPVSQIPNKHMSHMSHMSYIYQTGDLARFISVENIEFLGRIDQQVKIRGFRIDPGEIESLLYSHPAIKEAVVIAGQGGHGEEYLCAYTVGESSAGTLPGSAELKEYLSTRLPNFMVPSYFVSLTRLPLTPNGKIHRKALPEPELNQAKEYIAPGNWYEKKLAQIWAEILYETGPGPAIGIDDNFFDLGGHSLNAARLLAHIHKEFNVTLPLTLLFKKTTIRDLARSIQEAAPDPFESILPEEKKESYTLSPAQQRLYILQQLEPGSTVYNMPELIPLPGKPNQEQLTGTFLRLIQRQESLRTSFHQVEGSLVQKVHDIHRVEFTIETVAVQGRDDTEVKERFKRPFDLSRAPLLRVGLICMDDEKYLLIVVMHHIISDGLSQQVLRRDFVALDSDREPAPLRIQYKDFSQWQNMEKSKAQVKQQEMYWLKEFEGNIPALELPTDYPRTPENNPEALFALEVIGKDQLEALRSFEKREGVTMFMVLLAIYNVLFFKITGQEDISIGAVVAGRRHADLEQVIGMFVNTLVMRNFPIENIRFGEFLRRIKQRTLLALANQDYQFEDLVEKVVKKRTPGRNPLVEVAFFFESNPNNLAPMPAGQINKNQHRDYTQATFDISLGAWESKESLLCTFEYRVNLFKPETIAQLIGYFREIVSAVTANPEVLLADITVSIDLEAAEPALIIDDDVGFGF